MMPMSFLSTIDEKIHDVQEVRKVKPTIVPDRYVRDIHERPEVSLSSYSPPGDIPVIDLSKIINGDYHEFCPEIHRLASSCEEWGFFQVTTIHM